MYVFFIPESVKTVAAFVASATALAIAIFREQMGRWFYHPDLDLEAMVQIPNAQRVGRGRRQERDGYITNLGDAWYFRLAITNTGNAPARDVQLYLKRIEKVDGTNINRFSPMNLRWTHREDTTRKVLLRDIPAFCDFIHIGDPTFRVASGEDLPTVPLNQGIISLDVEAISSALAHLLEPGAYLFHLVLAAENSRARSFTVEVRYNGTWSPHEGQMLDQEIGFRMKNV